MQKGRAEPGALSAKQEPRAPATSSRETRAPSRGLFRAGEFKGRAVRSSGASRPEFPQPCGKGRSESRTRVGRGPALCGHDVT